MSELAITEVAAELGVSVADARALCRVGLLRYRRGEDGRWLVDAGDVEALDLQLVQLARERGETRPVYVHKPRSTPALRVLPRIELPFGWEFPLEED